MEATEASIMLLLEIGHEGACGLLKNLFVRPHEVARSPVSGLFQDIKPSRLDADAPCELSMSTESSQIALEQMECTADLNLLATLEKILKTALCNRSERRTCIG